MGFEIGSKVKIKNINYANMFFGKICGKLYSNQIGIVKNLYSNDIEIGFKHPETGGEIVASLPLSSIKLIKGYNHPLTDLFKPDIKDKKEENDDKIKENNPLNKDKKVLTKLDTEKLVDTKEKIRIREISNGLARIEKLDALLISNYSKSLKQ